MGIYSIDKLTRRLLTPFWPHLLSYQALIWILFIGRYYNITQINFYAWLLISLGNVATVIFIFISAFTSWRHQRRYLELIPLLYWLNSALTFILFYAFSYKGQELVLIPFLSLVIVSAYYSPDTTKIRYIYLILFLAIVTRYFMWPQLIQDKFILIQEWIYILAISTIPLYMSALAVRRQKNYQLIERLLASNRKAVQELNRTHKELSDNHDQTINRNKDLERDLAKAKTIQQQLLPLTLPEQFAQHVSIIYQPANQVGGDFYDIRMNHKKQLMVILADVFGHGVPAALVASMTKIVLDNIHWQELPPASVLAKLNEHLFNKTANLLISAFIIQIDIEYHKLRYANAGHLYPLLIGEQKREIIQAPGPLIGIFEDSEFSERERSYQSNDHLLLYTDGATDIHDRNNQSLGEDMFFKLAEKMEHRNIELWLSHIYRGIQLYSAQDAFEDDVTLIGIQL